MLQEDHNHQFNLVHIPGGSFLMGDHLGDGFPQERPLHQVDLAPFWLGSRCVTVGEYYAFIVAMGDAFDELCCDFINPCFILKNGDHYQIWPGAEAFPMVQVSFVGAIVFCNHLSQVYGFDPVYAVPTFEADLSKNGFRLPKEAEWEFSCGGPAHHPYGYGASFDPDRVCFRDYAGSQVDQLASMNRVGGFGLTSYSPMPVTALPPNEFGLYHMVGNVNEWCHDRYAPYDQDQHTNPSGPQFGSFRVLRGGCFLHGREQMRSSYRHGIHYQSKCMIDGFRLARNALPDH